MRHTPQLSPLSSLSTPADDVILSTVRPGLVKTPLPPSLLAWPGQFSLKECVSSLGCVLAWATHPPAGPGRHGATGDTEPAAATLQLLWSNIKLASTPNIAACILQNSHNVYIHKYLYFGLCPYP